MFLVRIAASFRALQRSSLFAHFLSVLKLAFVVGLFVLALFFLNGAFHRYSADDIHASIKRISATQLWLAAGFTFICYFILTGYDWLALNIIGRHLPYRKVALASFVSYAFSHSLGFAVLTSSSTRYRIYSLCGLGASDITRVILFCWVTFTLGYTTLTGVSFLLAPRGAVESLPFSIPLWLLHGTGAAILLSIAAYVAYGVYRQKPISILGWHLPVPGAKISLAQIFLSSLDLMAAGAILYVLLPESISIGYIEFLGIMVLAIVAAIFTHVPGGIGVFEAVIILFLKPYASTIDLAGSLIIYRVFFYVIPLIVAAILFLAHEFFAIRRSLRMFFDDTSTRISPFASRLLSLGAFVSGGLLLFSGAMPTHTLRQAFVANAFPPFAVDALHLLASAVGVALLLVGHALRHHVFAAYRISQCLLVIGATTVLLKGFEVGVAVFLILTLLVHLPFASSFYRRISILKLPYTRRWLTAIFLTLLGSVWVGFFYFKHLEKAALLPDMWFDFSQHSEAFLFLRASLIATFLALAWILLASLWRVHPRLLRPKLLTLEQCKDIFGALLDYRHARTFSPHRAVLLDRDGKSALCCVHRHCFWIALGDPLGDFSEARNLLWQFRELAEATHQQMFMLGVTENFRQSSYDIGLECFPFVEEAIVDLKNNLALPESAQQFTTRIITAEMQEYPSLAELQKLYSDWFSDGKDLSANIWETDLSRALDLSLPIIFLYEEGNTVGFSLLLTAKDMSIAACDHLRLSKNSGHQALSSIFSGAVLWAAESGYSAFSLGMAPFKNDSADSLPLLRSTEILAPHICLGADFVSSPSELRECKESFAPKWRPRFLAATSGLRLPAVIQEIHGLFHSGWSGNFPYPGQPKNPLV